MEYNIHSFLMQLRVSFMILIIDGYNLLKAIFPKVKRLKKEREQLICQLGFYKKQREGKIKDIVLVFDGGLERRATREIIGGVTVIFSGRGVSADDWIVDFVGRNKEKEMMLVSRDRELINRCTKKNIDVIKGDQFYSIMQNRLLESVEEDINNYNSNIKKYKKEYDSGKNNEINSESLDILMEQSKTALSETDKDINYCDNNKKKKGRSYTPSKKDKKRSSKIKKL